MHGRAFARREATDGGVAAAASRNGAGEAERRRRSGGGTRRFPGHSCCTTRAGFGGRGRRRTAQLQGAGQDAPELGIGVFGSLLHGGGRSGGDRHRIFVSLPALLGLFLAWVVILVMMRFNVIANGAKIARIHEERRGGRKDIVSGTAKIFASQLSKATAGKYCPQKLCSAHAT